MSQTLRPCCEICSSILDFVTPMNILGHYDLSSLSSKRWICRPCGGLVNRYAHPQLGVDDGKSGRDEKQSLES